MLCILGSCASLQFGAATAVPLFDDLGTWGVTLLRLGIGGLLLLAVSRPAVRAWRAGEWRNVFWLAVTMALMNGFYYAAIGRIPLSAAVALEFSGPLIFSALTSRNRRDLIWVGFAAAGMTVLGAESVVGGADLDPVGVVFALIAGVFWVGYIVFSAQVGQRIPGTGGLAVSMVLGAVLLIPVGAHGALAGVAGGDGGLLTRPGLFWFAAVTSLLASVLPYTLELVALRRISGAVFSILVSLEPAFAAVAGLMLLNQEITGYRIVTIVLVICASAGITWSTRYSAQPHQDAATDVGAGTVAAAAAASSPKTISVVTSPRDSSGHSAR
ncbi:hypothetical protein A606_00260 [Corynebacterium terpenotabidum Y-11]|uniref:EamA domain-containing protein n=1 Tax=Corynebacterium terpenotabidum Y-11 TaxID=1200352 RepID=S4XDP2_9CORY|nr:hypothetical protein A606_00260 [Corynebacterium terpenotabidum Y-11]